MSAKVFISYSRPDEAKGWRVQQALSRKKISAWFAPQEVPPGAIFSEKIAQAIRHCKVFLLLWSEHAASSEHVKNEIAIASGVTPKILCVPVCLDDTPRESYFLVRENWIHMADFGPDGVARSIDEYLRVTDAPYPLGALYSEIRDGALDFDRHLQAIRLLIRFIALVQVAGYVGLKERSDDLNRHIEKLFTLDSLFSDFDVARAVCKWLEEHGAAVHGAFQELFRLPSNRLPGTQEYEDNDYYADTFDEERLYLLCNLQNDLAKKSTVSYQQARENFCHGIRDFLRQALTQDWSSACQLFISFEEGGSQKPFMAPSELSESETSNARFYLHTTSRSLDLDPFVTLVPLSQSGLWDVGVLRKQDDSAHFTRMTTNQGDQAERAPIVLPWGRVEIARTIPRISYVGEIHSVRLQLTNNTRSSVFIPSIEERLPDNLTTADGQSTVSAATGLELAAGDTCAVEYQVKGANIPGAKRSFSAASVAFFYENKESVAKIEGDHEVLVRAIPEPTLIVTRRLLSTRGSPVGARVSLDSELTVEVEIRSDGGGLARVRIEEEIAGAVSIGGNALLYDGAVDRVDLQQPIVRSYKLLVTGPEILTIRMHATSDGARVALVGAESRVEVDDMPPPRIVLSWKSVAPQGSDHIEACLLVANTGGTAAYGLEVHITAPGNVTAFQSESPADERLAAGAQRIVLAKLACLGVPSGSVRFTVAYRSIGNDTFEESLTLDLQRVIETDISNLPVLGRLETREEVRRALTDPEVVICNLHGERGVGKKRILLAEIDRLKHSEGRQIVCYEFDCGITDSFAHAITGFLQSVIDQETPEKDRGSDTALTEFLNRAGMDDQFKGLNTILGSLLSGDGKPSHGTWRALALLLTKIATAKRLNVLVILLRSVSRFTKAELEVLGVLRQNLQPPVSVRIVLTSFDPLNVPFLDQEIQIAPLSEEDCKELISRVFVMPNASPALQQALILKSERLPGNLVSLLRYLIDKSDLLLDFNVPDGARIRDLAGFRNLPTSLVQSTRKAAESSEIPRAVLACLAAFREKFTVERLHAVLQELDEAQSVQSLRGFLSECHKRHWLQVSNGEFEIPSASVRESFTLAVPRDMLEKVHQTLFTLYEQEQCSSKVCFSHLVDAPVEFITQRSLQLTTGLRTLVSEGWYSQVRIILSRLLTANFTSDPAVYIELREIEQEVQLEEKGKLDPQHIESLFQKLAAIPNRNQRNILKTRLCILASRWHYHQEDYSTAAHIAESVEQNWPSRRLPVNDQRLEYEFYLNLWTIYYRMLDEEKFADIDARIWKRLAAGKDGKYDSYAIARFLGQFLEFHRQFSSPMAREQHFPVRWVGTGVEARPLRANKIELLTRIERIRKSFLDDFLEKPDKLNQTNMLVLGRLYLDKGAALWLNSVTRNQLADHPPKFGEVPDSEAESYLLRAEGFFAEGGFIFDLANARSIIGDAYLDKLRLAKKKSDDRLALELCSVSAQWLKRAANDFEAINAQHRACDTWELHADVLRQWTGYQSDILPEAIQAHEDLLKLTALSTQPEKLDACRLALVRLYQQAGVLEDAARILSSMGAQTTDVLQLRAMIHAEELLAGRTSVTPRNVAEYERDLETLRSSPATTYPTKGEKKQHFSNSNQVKGVVSWHLVNFYAQERQVTPALQLLRELKNDIVATPVLRGALRATLPELLPKLWQMEGSPDDRMTQDFSNLLLPLVVPADRPVLERMLQTVSAWESSRSGGVHLAVADMSLVLCESFIDQRGENPELERTPAQNIFNKILQRNIWESKALMRIVARALAVMLRASAASRSESVLRVEVADLLEDLKRQKLYSTALGVLVCLIEALLEVHRNTRQGWYFTIINKLSVQLGPLQELSENDFEEVTSLIGLYLQLPNHMADAVDLMEKQCEHLLAQKDYELLPRYLSFLSDLIGDVLRQDRLVARLLKLNSEESSQTIPAAEGLLELKKTSKIKEVATELCARIIAEVRKRPLGGSSEHTLLYNAAKLLSGSETADLQAAVYVKLYTLADGVDGSCVWAVYSAWSKHANNPANLSLDDSVALTTFSNCQEEAVDGEFQGNPRNYLINAKARNRLVKELTKKDPANLDLFVVYAELEIQRLRFLLQLISSLNDYLKEQDEFERMEWVTFFYGYLLPNEDNVPIYQKLLRIEDQRDELSQQVSYLINELGRCGIVNPGKFSKQDMHALSCRAQHFIISNRTRGREIMNQLTQRIQPFSLANILGEIQSQLEGHRRSIDFGAILGLSLDSGDDYENLNSNDANVAAFLERDPRGLIKPLVTTAMMLLQQNEPDLAERLFRSALGFCEASTNEDASDLSAILRGLTQSLVSQSRFEEAENFALREIEVKEAKADPELGIALEQFATILHLTGRTEEAIPYLRRKFDSDRDNLKPEDFAPNLANFAHFLHEAGHEDEGEILRRQAETILRDAIDRYEKDFGLESPNTIRAIENLAALLDESDRKDEAIALYFRVIEIKESLPHAMTSAALALDMNDLALKLRKIGRFEEAAAILRRAIVIEDANLPPKSPQAASPEKQPRCGTDARGSVGECGHGQCTGVGA